MNNFLECGLLSENPLSLPLQIHHVDWQAPSPDHSITGDRTNSYIRKNDHEPCCPFHDAQYLADLLHEHCQLPLEFLTQKLSFQISNNKLWSRIVAGLV